MMAHHNKSNKEGADENPMFHDFLGMRCDSSVAVVPKQNISWGVENRLSEASASVGASSSGTHGPISTTSDLASERQLGNHFVGVPGHGPRSDSSGSEISNILLGRKRSNSDSVFMGSMTREKTPQIGLESLEGLHRMKMIGNSAGVERQRRSYNEDLFFGMQPPRLTSTPQIFHPPVGRTPDSIASKLERSIMNSGPMTHHYIPRGGQLGTYVDSVFPNRYRDGNAGPSSVISQPAADEGSRTGIKGSGILSTINTRTKTRPQFTESESSKSGSQHGLISGSQQMTIFYDGQAHVFDDVHQHKADIIMALAGSNGGSWSTTYSPKSALGPPFIETHEPSEETQELHGSLSIKSNSSPQFRQAVQISTPQDDSLNKSSGGQQIPRLQTQLAHPNTEGKREV
ncbi:hypothetical protein GIB67_030682 [Kingdonia uniflora]|uniref:Protein TIFY n=1 Tax=Kingdonia uniflora TaxID=39325 RepID=A0A7J7NIE2_9MAGN|nr:hypothetical protein GIB67_030682 [Kingdonia uniflora]